MSENQGDKPIIWFDRPVGRLQRDLVGDAAEVTSVSGDGPELAGLAGADAAIVGAAISYDAALFRQAPRLRVVTRAGIGYDNVNLTDATTAGIAACNTPDAPTASTAEHAVGLIFAITKGLRESCARLERAEGDYWGRHVHLELEGATLTLLGLGRIGGRVARTMRDVGMNVIAYDPYVAAAHAAELGVTLADTPAEAVAAAHVVSVHAPLTDATRHLVDADLIGEMRRGTYLVNTSRGGLVDQDALLTALDDGQLRAAGLDVTDPEPLPAGHPLLKRDDVIVTPHVASSTGAGRVRLFEHAVAETLTALDGNRPPNLLNEDVWPGRCAPGWTPQDQTQSS